MTLLATPIIAMTRVTDATVMAITPTNSAVMAHMKALTNLSNRDLVPSPSPILEPRVALVAHPCPVLGAATRQRRGVNSVHTRAQNGAPTPPACAPGDALR